MIFFYLFDYCYCYCCFLIVYIFRNGKTYKNMQMIIIKLGFFLQEKVEMHKQGHIRDESIGNRKVSGR